MTVALLAMAGNALADDFAIADLTLNPGETKTISIELNNPEMSYMAFEFYMTLPEGVSIPEDEDGYFMAELNSARINRHVLEVSQMDDGSYHFLCYSNRNTSLKGTSGEMISLTVTAAENATLGTLEGKLLKQVLSDLDMKKVTFDDYAFPITVVQPVPTSVSIIIPEEGATTYCPSYGIDFSGVTAFEAYVAAKYGDGEVIMLPASDAPAGTALFLQGTPGEYTVDIKETQSAYANLLAGTAAATTISATSGDKSNLVLSVANGTPTFTAATDGTAVPDNGAWLQLPTASYQGGAVTVGFLKNGPNADLNEDGRITVTDVMILVKMVLSH